MNCGEVELHDPACKVEGWVASCCETIKRLNRTYFTLYFYPRVIKLVVKGSEITLQNSIL